MATRKLTAYGCAYQDVVLPYTIRYKHGDVIKSTSEWANKSWSQLQRRGYKVVPVSIIYTVGE